ncbi:NAD(P)-dependent oxidoreductase [Pedobacter aquae]|uniref:NAD(P)-dependent oxidoreductase n=1 Tax=Pedobacter aquae TaxID=2605747 RepID=A0A5C0VEY7_9SPHI|nr:NAD(P)-dependent oxidoreductase [Pedobacter aquae]QEK50647.1 NAD(P)-dependent oxidoreductase [Pedobacter aquae]
MTKKIAFLGLGNMGIPIAQNLINAGHEVSIYNRSAVKAQQLTGNYFLANSPAEAVADKDFVFTMLADDNALNQICTGENGFILALKKGAIHISMSTIAPETSAILNDIHHKNGSIYLSSPVFGRPTAAAEAKLFICLSGQDEAKQLAKPLLEQVGQAVYDFGEDVKAANVLKLTGNFMIMASMETMAEAFTLAEKNGLDRKQVADFFGNTVFNAPIYKNYGTLIANNNYQPVGFKSTLGFKDARLASKMALDAEMPAPLLNLVYNRLLSAIAQGKGEQDWAESIAKGVSNDAGI